MRVGGLILAALALVLPVAVAGAEKAAPRIEITFDAKVSAKAFTGRLFVMTSRRGRGQPLSGPSWFGTEPFFAKGFSDMEEVLGRGGQLGSFEAAFSPRGADGRPMRLWDRKTGEFDPKVALAWRKYDIAHNLETRWKDLGRKLAGKLHVYCGDRDTFWLDLAVVRLKALLEKLESDAVVEIIPGAGHGLPPRVMAGIMKSVAAQYRERFLEKKKAK